MTARTWTDCDGLHVDVRGLQPPQPLVAILRLIDGTPGLSVLTVHHDRDPQLLYPELAERAWGADRLAAPDGEVRLHLAPLDPDAHPAAAAAGRTERHEPPSPSAPCPPCGPAGGTTDHRR